MSLSDLASELDLEAALAVASRGSDLLPQRPDEGVGGEVAQRFHESLRYRLAGGSYSASPSYILSVPKPGYTTRPAAVLTLEDRTVYEAVVSRLSERIERHLLSREVVYAHRAIGPRRPWREFEQAPLTGESSHVVRADVFGYYETIQHDVLVQRLIEVTGDRLSAVAIGQLLGEFSRSPRGLPQGTRASDALATIYFDPVDREMLRSGYAYFRYGDDVRIAVDSFDAGREAIAVLESSVRELGLSLNGSKTRVLRLETYQKQIKDSDAARDELQQRMHEARISALETTVEEAEQLEQLEGLLTDDMLWGLYAGEVSIADIVEEMKPLLEPNVVEVAEQLFLDTMEKAPWTDNSLRREAFHVRFVRALALLRAGESLVPLEHVERLFYRLPDETEELAHYLGAIASEHPQQVRRTVRRFLLSPAFRHEWQEVWLHKVLAKCLPLGNPLLAHLEKVASDEESGWFVRVSALNLLAMAGGGDRALASRMWELCPAPFRAELIAAAAWREQDPDWERLLEGCRGDPVHEVVISHVRQARETLDSDSTSS